MRLGHWSSGIARAALRLGFCELRISRFFGVIVRCALVYAPAQGQAFVARATVPAASSSDPAYVLPSSGGTKRAWLVPFGINKKPLPPCGRGLTVDLRRADFACLPAAYRPVIIIRATRRRLRSRLLFARVIMAYGITYNRTRRSILQKLQNCQGGIWAT